MQLFTRLSQFSQVGQSVIIFNNDIIINTDALAPNNARPYISNDYKDTFFFILLVIMIFLWTSGDQMTSTKLTDKIPRNLAVFNCDEYRHRQLMKICHNWPGVGDTKLIPQFCYFLYFSTLSKQWSPIEYHVQIWQVSLQLSCCDTCQIGKWFNQPNRYFCKIQNFLHGKINKQSFSAPHPKTGRNQTIAGNTGSSWH